MNKNSLGDNVLVNFDGKNRQDSEKVIVLQKKNSEFIGIGGPANILHQLWVCRQYPGRGPTSARVRVQSGP